MKRTGILLSILLTLTIAASSCSKEPAQVLMMATTTSTDNTGLLDVLAPEFKKDTNIELKWVSVGTGKAIQMGQNCDVDVLLVHDPDSEKEFVEKGYGINRTELMFNDFIIAGPEDDPAGISGKSVIESLNRIRSAKSTFTSRGDKSGTHMLELQLWKSTGRAVPEKEAWYIQTGQGMIQTINIAAERKGYTITDRGTFIKYEDNHKGNPPIVILVEGDKSLFNQYSAIEVNPEKCTNAKNDLAKKFIEWMASDKAQKMIGEFKLLNKPLFTPNAKK